MPTLQVHWHPGRGMRHEAASALAATLLLDRADLQALTLPVARELWAYLGGSPDPANLFRQLLSQPPVRARALPADGQSVRRICRPFPRHSRPWRRRCSPRWRSVAGRGRYGSISFPARSLCRPQRPSWWCPRPSSRPRAPGPAGRDAARWRGALQRPGRRWVCVRGGGAQRGTGADFGGPASAPSPWRCCGCPMRCSGGQHRQPPLRGAMVLASQADTAVIAAAS